MTQALITVLAATEKSKVPFYIAGGVFAAWAVTIAIVGLRSPDFPGTPQRARMVMAVSLLLALGATSTAVITS